MERREKKMWVSYKLRVFDVHIYIFPSQMDGGGGVHWTCERMLRRDNIRKPKINVFSYEIHVQLFFFLHLFYFVKTNNNDKGGKNIMQS